MALVEDVLVILGCKNAIFPCNIFELRTSGDRCVEAAEQLDRASAAFAAPRIGTLSSGGSVVANDLSHTS